MSPDETLRPRRTIAGDLWNPELRMRPSDSPTQLHTARLLLRGWRDSDLAPLAALNADPEVMEHFPSTLSRAQSDGVADRIVAALKRRGWGLWAVEDNSTGTFIGFVGLNPVPFEAPFTPAIEIGWRLARPSWGSGLATEAASAVLAHAFGPLGLEELVSFTPTTNLRSQRVMQKLGMRHDPADDFDHPSLPDGHRLRRHVLYRITTGEPDHHRRI
jgi:RimJ/RimL family protein N-acetyltransferase